MSQNLRDVLRRGPECPPIELLIESLESERDSKIRLHASTCPACRAEIALYQGFEAPVEPEEREAVDFIVRRLHQNTAKSKKPSLLERLLSPLRWSPGLGAWAMAAAVVVLSVGLVSQWRTRQAEPVAETEAGKVLRSGTIRIETPLEDVASVPGEIRWEPVAGAASYDVTLSEVDRTVIFHGSFTTNVLVVTGPFSKLIVPGKKVFLTVSARDAGGNELAASGRTAIQMEIQSQTR